MGRWVKKLKISTKQSGFTLTELLVVISIIALMGAMVVPATVTMIDSHRRTAARNLIRTALAQARAHAAQTQRYAGLRFQYDADGWRNGRQYLVIIENDTGGGDYDRFIAIPNAKPAALPVGMGVISLDSIIYNPASQGQIDENNENLDDGLGHPDNASNKDNGLLDASTFSIIFSPTGQLVSRRVEIHGQTGRRIFGTENSTNLSPTHGNFRLLSHDYNPATSAPWCVEEMSTTGLYIFETDRMTEAEADLRYSQYIYELKPVLINIYTGMLIEEEF